MMHLIKKAKQMAIEQVFVLTRVPEFFTQLGFTSVSKSQLPEKVMKDCEICPRFHACDEVALTYNIAGPATISTFSHAEIE